MDFAEIIAGAKLPERTVPLVLRGDLIAEYDRLSTAFDRADTTLTEDVTATGVAQAAIAAAERMEALREQIADSVTLFTLRALPRKRWRKMIADNPPGEDDEGDVDEESFVTDMIAVCCTDPVMTRTQAEHLRDEVLTDGQWQELANAAWALNKNMVEVPLSIAASSRLASARAVLNTTE